MSFEVKRHIFFSNDVTKQFMCILLNNSWLCSTLFIWKWKEKWEESNELLRWMFGGNKREWKRMNLFYNEEDKYWIFDESLIIV